MKLEPPISQMMTVLLLGTAALFDMLSLIGLIPLVGWLLEFGIGALGGIVFFVWFQFLTIGSETNVKRKEASALFGLDGKLRGRLQAALMARLGAAAGEMLFFFSWMPLFSLSTGLSILIINGKDTVANVAGAVSNARAVSFNVPRAVGEFSGRTPHRQPAQVVEEEFAPEPLAQETGEGRPARYTRLNDSSIVSPTSPRTSRRIRPA